METDRWKKLKDVFSDAIEHRPEDRLLLVRQACGQDTHLFSEAMLLLEEYERADTFLSSPLFDKSACGRNRRPPQLESGSLLAERFMIVRFIARGGMGEVYEAEDIELGEPVALKTIRPELAVQPAALALFKREIRLARRVAHYNICRTFDLGYHITPTPEGGRRMIPFCTMELLCGETLSEYLRKQGPIRADRALPLLKPIGKALQAAHQAGVIHGDLKPGNVMLVRETDGSPRVAVTDFGLALPALLTGNGPGHPYGTHAYMAPERWRNETMTAAADIYSLGKLIDRVIGRHGKRTGNIPTDFSSGSVFDPVIARCCDSDPTKRYPSASAVVAALRTALENAAFRGR